MTDHQGPGRPALGPQLPYSCLKQHQSPHRHCADSPPGSNARQTPAPQCGPQAPSLMSLFGPQCMSTTKPAEIAMRHRVLWGSCPGGSLHTLGTDAWTLGPWALQGLRGAILVGLEKTRTGCTCTAAWGSQTRASLIKGRCMAIASPAASLVTEP